MGVHEWAVDLASDLIIENGRSITLRRKSQTLQSSSEPWLGTVDTWTDHSATAVETSRMKTYDDGTLVLEGERFYSLPAKGLSITPAPGDLLIDTETLVVRSARPIQPGPDLILHRVQVTA